MMLYEIPFIFIKLEQRDNNTRSVYKHQGNIKRKNLKANLKDNIFVCMNENRT